MFQILNETPLQAALGFFTDSSGREIVSVVCKGTFNIPNAGQPPVLAKEQVKVLYTDQFYGDPSETSIKYPIDLVLGKVGTDIGLVGKAYSPDGKPVRELLVTFSVGTLTKTLLVIGDRIWKKQLWWLGFHMTDPVPFTTMPIIYERAFGGMDLTHRMSQKRQKFGENPVGTGFRINKKTVAGTKLPNLENPDERIRNWRSKPSASCLGFTAPSWEPRTKFAGTYDEKWRQEHFPLLPVDFNLRFFNCASKGLDAIGFLQGEEPVRLFNLSRRGNIAFDLPSVEISMIYRLGTEVLKQKGELWTVLFEPDEDRFYLVWGSVLPVGKQPSKMKSVEIKFNSKADISHAKAQVMSGHQ